MRLTLRTLARSPLYALLVVITLAIGIGPTTAIFSVVHALLLRELPYRDSDALVVLWRFRNAGDHAPVSGPDFADFRGMNGSFSDMAAAARGDSFNVGGLPQPIRVEGTRVTPNFFTLLGTPPLLGALPTGAPIGGAREVILGHDLWQQSFGGRDVIGSAARLNGEPYTIVAVMPPDFAWPALPQPVQLWVPQDLTTERLGHRAYHRLGVVARLRPGVTLEQADAEMKRIARRLGDLYPDTTRGIGASVSPLRETLTGSVRKPLLMLLGAVVFLLLIACSNVANIALTRAASRRKEISVRMALGAGLGRVARQLLAESIFLSIVGGVLGLALAGLSIRVLRSLGAAYFARPEQIALDRTVLAFNFGVAVLTGIAFGLAALLARGSLFDVLRTGDRAASHGGREGRLAREAIVVSIIAFSFFLLIGAGLMVRNFLKIRAVEVGMRVEGATTLRVYLPETKYPDLASRTSFYEQFLRRITALQGVDGAAIVNGLPLENTMSGDIVFPGESDPIAARRIATFTEISPGFLRAAGVPLIRGREFTWDDVRHLPAQMAAGQRAPILVNQTYAARYGRGAVLGQELLVGGDLPAVIVGVVGDVKQTDLRQPTPAHVYMPLGAPLPLRAANVMIRSASLPPAVVVSLATATLRRMDPDVPPYRIRTMQQVVDDSLAGSRFQAVLLTAFAAIAVFLATIGIYGVISYTVAQRTREVAIRMAIGAASADVVRLVLLRVLRLAAIGLFVGILGALMLTRWLGAMLFEIDAADPAMLSAIAAITLVTAVVASTLPARRAAMLDPMTALRAE